MVEILCENKEDSQHGENSCLTPNLSLNKKNAGVKPHECSECGKVFMNHSSLTRHIRCNTGHKPNDYLLNVLSILIYQKLVSF